MKKQIKKMVKMKKLLRNQNKIIIDISKDKLDTINEANNNSKKKENNQSLFIYLRLDYMEIETISTLTLKLEILF